MLDIAASDTLFPCANFVCMTLVRLRTKLPYHFDRTVITGTLINANNDSCHDTININISTPITCTNDLKKTCCFEEKYRREREKLSAIYALRLAIVYTKLAVL